MIVYLAGGMRSSWRTAVIERDGVGADSAHTYILPTIHGIDASMPDAYTLWDLMGVRQCDILFGYMEKGNPSGYGLAVEIGYAKALSKPIILVDESENKNFNMVRSCSDVLTDNLDDGIRILLSFGLLPNKS